DDRFFLEKLDAWLANGTVSHDVSHVTDYRETALPAEERRIGEQFALRFRVEKAIMGVFDEGCMGMFNAIVPDNLLHATGVFKERLSQSALYARMLAVTDDEAEEVLRWLQDRGMTFKWGTDEATELTRRQTIEQCKMYIAAVRIADEFGCDTIGIQYQQGLKDLTVASDLVEGLLNNTERPPVFDTDGRELFPGVAIPHFNEVDDCSGLDSLLTYHLWR